MKVYHLLFELKKYDLNNIFYEYYIVTPKYNTILNIE